MNTSYKVVELVKQRIGTEYLQASDADAAKVLGISRTSVSHYKSGRDVMGNETLLRAQEILQLKTPDFLTLMLDIQLDGTKHEGYRTMLKAVRDVAAMYATKAGSKVAGILLAGCIAWSASPDAAASVKAGFSAQGAAGGEVPALYIMVNRVRAWLRDRRRALGRFLRQFPVPPLLPAQPLPAAA